MSYNKIFKQGSKISIVVPSTESIAVKTEGVAKVYKVVGYPNVPNTRDLVGTVTAGETIFGAYASGATIEIDCDESGAAYSVGVSPLVSLPDSKFGSQSTPGVLNATGALTAAMIMTGIGTSTVMEAASEFAIGDSLDFSVIATGANAFTVTAATGITIVGDAVVATATSGLFRLRKTAASVYVIYRLAK